MSCETVLHLSQDHAEIRNVLDAFEVFLDQFTGDAAPDRHELWSLLDALSEGLLLRHEEKEETVLLPQLNRMGLSWSDGTLAHVRSDHRHGRYLMRSLRQAAHQSCELSSEDRRHFLAMGREWDNFMLHHMLLEESLLFPYLDANLSAIDDAEVVRHFCAIDEDFEKMADSEMLRVGKERFVEKFASVLPPEVRTNCA